MAPKVVGAFQRGMGGAAAADYGADEGGAGTGVERRGSGGSDRGVAGRVSMAARGDARNEPAAESRDGCSSAGAGPGERRNDRVAAGAARAARRRRGALFRGRDGASVGGWVGAAAALYLVVLQLGAAVALPVVGGYEASIAGLRRQLPEEDEKQPWRPPEPLSGEEHQFQFLVFVLIMIVLGLIILAACTFRFEKHCL